MTKKIKYEPHPVSPARKAELVAEGYKIIDAKFAPADHEPEPETLELTRESIAKMKKPQLRELLKLHKAPAEGTVPELRERLEQVVFVDA